MRILPLLALFACSPADEEAIVATSSLVADVTLTALDDLTAEVVMTLQQEGKGQFYELELDEEITITLPSILVTLISRTLDDQPAYIATVPDPPANVDLIVAFNRTPPRKTAPLSLVALPLGFDLSAPASFSRSSDDIEVAWTAANQVEPLTIALIGTCFDSFEADIEDTGSYVIPAGTVSGDTESCPAKLTLRRWSEGSVDERLAGGSLIALQERSSTLTADP